jgi:hypothetical protein
MKHVCLRPAGLKKIANWATNQESAMKYGYSQTPDLKRYWRFFVVLPGRQFLVALWKWM